MRIFRKILLGLIGLVLLLVVVGFLLPSHFAIARSIIIKAPAERIYAQLDDPRAWKAWSVWPRRDPAMEIKYSGTNRGIGARWDWKSKTEGNGGMTFTGGEPGKLLVYKLEFPELGMVSTGVLKLEPADAGVKLTWTNEGEMGMNPMNRFIGQFMDKMVGPDFEAGLAQLKQNVEAAH